MSCRLGNHNLEEGTGFRVTKGQSSLHLPPVHRLYSRAHHLGNVGPEVHAKPNDSYPDSVKTCTSKHHIEQNHQKHHHRRPLQNTDIGDSDGIGHLVLGKAHQTNQESENSPENRR